MAQSTPQKNCKQRYKVLLTTTMQAIIIAMSSPDRTTTARLLGEQHLATLIRVAVTR